ncbi:CDP-glucose 4,6-dehydratase [Roseomonas genomospecies 6]|uniref:CDP-glucose 4,6-dehydratase n=1 Tax=Roseomonas genomospecies 6 TaxID=214106 RepID=A0A9W7KRB9_9PROT|nr:CDP-glucose 4,6-dehydratase [Roseomonas genomospecies 6]KAA0678250.1 CDP-glucose 4,6-dehydratase [Roseomonas genomospecies 6]
MTSEGLAGARVLVTGHTGFKGAWLTEWLLAEGAEVAGLALAPPEDAPNLFRDLRLGERMRSTLGDIRDWSTVRRVVEEFRPQVVFHLAAQPLVRRSYAEPIETFGTNVMGTAHLLEAARLSETVRAFVCVTTDKCYENNEWVWGYRETDRLGGKDPYSLSKAAAELVAKAYYERKFVCNGMNIATARGGNVIGGGDWAEDRIIPDLVRAIQAGKPLVLRNPKAIRPWQHVLELVRGYIVLAKALLGDRADGAAGAWNFGPRRGNEVEVGTLVADFCQVWGGLQTPVVVEPSGLPESHFLKLDIAKAEAGLGWQPAIDFKTTLELTAGWYRDYLADPSIASQLVNRQIAQYRQLCSAAGQ